jgi:UDPglucose 6-dehydrogenase
MYSLLYFIEMPFVITDVQTSELTKYSSKAFLATKTFFINEIANIGEQVGADVHQVDGGMGLDGRIGPKFHHPDPGFGGSCFPKDLMAIERIGRDHSYSFDIVKAVMRESRSSHVQSFTNLENPDNHNVITYSLNSSITKKVSWTEKVTNHSKRELHRP